RKGQLKVYRFLDLAYSCRVGPRLPKASPPVSSSSSSASSFSNSTLVYISSNITHRKSHRGHFQAHWPSSPVTHPLLLLHSSRYLIPSPQFLLSSFCLYEVHTHTRKVRPTPLPSLASHRHSERG